jgi:hypothetical protein
MNVYYEALGLRSDVMLLMGKPHRRGMVMFAMWRIFVMLLFCLAMYLAITWSRSELNNPTIKIVLVGLVGLITIAARNSLFHNWTTNLDRRVNSKTFRGFYLEGLFALAIALFTATIITSWWLYTQQIERSMNTKQAERLALLKYGTDNQLEKIVSQKRELLSAIQEFEYRLNGGALAISEEKFRLRRKALVVGNSDYKFAEDLPGVRNDISQLPKVFSSAGYSITLVKNESYDETELAISQFVKGISEQDIVILYIAGHGYSLGGRNMLASTTYKEDEDRAAASGHHIENWFNQILSKKPKFSFFVLDACRDLEQEKSYLEGLTKAPARQGFDPMIFKTYTTSSRMPFIILQSARAGQKANDRIGDCLIGKSCQPENRMSPFASEFINNFKIDSPVSVLIRNTEKGLAQRIVAARQNPPSGVDVNYITDQDIEVRSSSGGMVIRHIAPESKLAVRREKLQDDVLFDELKACKDAEPLTLSCLEREKDKLTKQINFLESNAVDISGFNAKALAHTVDNSGTLSLVIRETARNIAFLPMMLCLTLFLCLDIVICFIGHRTKVSNEQNRFSLARTLNTAGILSVLYNAFFMYRIVLHKIDTPGNVDL